MIRLLRSISNYMYLFVIISGLIFSSSVFTVLLYLNITEARARLPLRNDDIAAAAPLTDAVQQQAPVNSPVKKISALLDAPVILQNPELPSGCEITALTMMLQYNGINKNKMELLPEMKRDPTPIQWGKDGKIKYWGNPNIGYVGDITGKEKGFGIYHAGLYDLLHAYIPTAVDLTGGSFDELEQYVSDGVPVLVWTTIRNTAPTDKQWVVWDSPLGPIKTTFQEHTVLLVGYDEQHVYVNDPLSGKKQYKVEKEQFIASWEALGKQALTYTKNG